MFPIHEFLFHPATLDMIALYHYIPIFFKLYKYHIISVNILFIYNLNEMA